MLARPEDILNVLFKSHCNSSTRYRFLPKELLVCATPCQKCELLYLGSFKHCITDVDFCQFSKICVIFIFIAQLLFLYFSFSFFLILCDLCMLHVHWLKVYCVSVIGGGSIYKVGGPDAKRRRCQRDGGRSERRVRNLYQLFILK